MTRSQTESNEFQPEPRDMRTSAIRPSNWPCTIPGVRGSRRAALACALLRSAWFENVVRSFRLVRLTRFRFVAVVVVSLLALIAGISVWRMRSADELPDFGDPFDITLALRAIAIPDRDNAFAAYAKGRIDSRVAPPELWDAAWNCRIDALTWSKAKPEIRAFQQSNLATLQIWRDGSERADAVYRQPSELAFVTRPLLLLTESVLHSGMAALEGSRLEEQAAMAEHGYGTGRCCDRAGWSEGMARFMSGDMARKCTSLPRGAFCAGPPIRASMPQCCAALSTMLWLRTV